MKKTILFIALSLACTLAHAQTQVIQYGPDIVRVLKGKDHKSYSIIMSPQKSETASFRWEEDSNGNLTFLSNDGKVLLRETGTASTPISEGVDKGHLAVSQTWRLDKDEQIFGLGQRREGQTMSQRGQSFRLWNTNTHTYIPYFTSEKGYGVYWDNAGETWFSDNADGTTFRSSVSDGVDYYFIYRDGTQDGVMAGIRQLTGQATMFPLWAYGFWQCRERYKTPDEVAEVLDEFRKREIPIDAIVQDWQYWGCDSNWNSMKFENPHYLNKIGDKAQMRFLPNDENADREIEKFNRLGQPRLKAPQDMVDYVHNNNAHIMITIWPDFGPWTKQYAELKKINALLPFDTWPRNRGVLVYDAFNPKARDIYWKYLTNLYKMGMDAWWTDSTEPDHFEHDGDSDYITHDGSWRSVKNAFSIVTNRGIYEHQRAMKGNQKRSLQMTRSGAFGIHHYGTFSWSGDIQSTWEEMKNQIPSGLNYVICGTPMWNTDLGGFFCWDYNNDPKNPWAQEINVRWMQWGTFMPLMRSHCSSPMVTEIYKYGEPGEWAYDAMKSAIQLRYRLLPYIYSTAGMTVQNSEVMMRPFVMDFPHDKKAILRDDEYMFGRSILVKPVTDPLYTWKDEKKKGHVFVSGNSKADENQFMKLAATPVDVYLPEGTLWFDLYTGARYNGGRQYKVAAPIDRIPAFVRAGSILPLGPSVQYSGEKDWSTLDVDIYPGSDGSFALYEDEGNNYNYENGKFSTITFTWNDTARTLTIADRRGTFNGMLTDRTFNLRLVGGQSKSIRYDGSELVVKF